MNSSPGLSHNDNNHEIDWFVTYETIQNNKSLFEQFIQLFSERDKKKAKSYLN